MNEKLLQYLWKFKLLSTQNLCDVDGNPIEILDFGNFNSDEGPDFQMAKIRINQVILAGPIEIHVKSSDWYLHQHQQQKNYENVILHIVYQHDREISELSEKGISTVELKNYIPQETLTKYQNLQQHFQFIPCEKTISQNHISTLFSHETILKKLDEKSLEIEELLSKYKNDYEKVLFIKIAYAFGLKVNASVFQQIAENLEFKIIQKLSQNAFQLETLLLGKANLLAIQNPDAEIFQKEFQFLQSKFQFDETTYPAKFLRLMPPSFPTIRLSQLANLYHQQKNLFSKIIHAGNIKDITSLFENVKASEYWNMHFVFGKEVEFNERKISKDFVEIVLLNAIFPTIYTYFKHNNSEKIEILIEWYQSLKPEKNSIIKQWKNLGIEIKSALDSQAFLYHQKIFCQSKKCLNCGIGYKILQS